MSVQLAVRSEPTARLAPQAPARHLVLYGDFNCPWSYLASRRAALLEDAGATVDWRAVEHAPWRPTAFADSSARFRAMREELPEVEAHLLPGELLPHALSGFLPHTKAAVSGYAEAYAAAVPARVRPLLFEAFWLHGLDLGDARVVRTLLIDAVRAGSSPSDPLRRWGYAVDVTGGPVTTTAWRLIGQWRREWRTEADGTVPLLYVDGADPVRGVAAVDRLGEELRHRGVDVGRLPAPRRAPAGHRDQAPLSWVSQHGGRWLRRYQDAHEPGLFRSAG